MLYESLVVFAIAFFAGLAFHGVAIGPISGNTRLVFQLYLFLVLGAYFIGCWSHGGRTLPMQTWKMRMVRPDNLPVGVGRAALRRDEDLEAQAAKPLHLGRIDVQRPAFRGAALVA